MTLRDQLRAAYADEHRAVARLTLADAKRGGKIGDLIPPLRHRDGAARHRQRHDRSDRRGGADRGQGHADLREGTSWRRTAASSCCTRRSRARSAAPCSARVPRIVKAKLYDGGALRRRRRRRRLVAEGRVRRDLGAAQRREAAQIEQLRDEFADLIREAKEDARRRRQPRSRPPATRRRHAGRSAVTRTRLIAALLGVAVAAGPVVAQPGGAGPGQRPVDPARHRPRPLACRRRGPGAAHRRRARRPQGGRVRLGSLRRPGRRAPPPAPRSAAALVRREDRRSRGPLRVADRRRHRHQGRAAAVDHRAAREAHRRSPRSPAVHAGRDVPLADRTSIVADEAFDLAHRSVRRADRRLLQVARAVGADRHQVPGTTGRCRRCSTCRPTTARSRTSAGRWCCSWR